MTRGARRAAAFRTLTAAFLVAWLVLPLLPLALWSVARGWRYPALLPDAWSAEAWAFALSARSGVVESLGLTLTIAGCVTLLSVLIGVPAGRALGRHRFRGRGLVELAILAPVIVPAIAVAPGLHALFLWLGLANTVAGVTLAHLVPAVPYMTLVMAGIFANHDPRFEDQARSLGAGPLRTFRHVTLPAILPGLVAGALFAFLVSWSQYLLTLMIGGGRVITLPLLLFNYAAAGRNDFTGAIAILYILPGALVLALAGRQVAGTAKAARGLRRG